ncbi:MAG: ABC transporter permease, partial [bacterium]
AALILIMISALLTSIAIVREKETGTMEQILVSPIRPIEIIVGKVVPYVFLAFVDLIIILLIAHFVFDVPFVGHLGLLLFASLIFIFAALSLGLLISTKAQTQQVAMLMALMVTLLPTVILSGFIFPISSLPKILQLVTYVVPARYFMVVIRGIMLKGNVFTQLVPEISILAAIGFVLLIISAKKFKTTLEV